MMDEMTRHGDRSHSGRRAICCLGRDWMPSSERDLTMRLLVRIPDVAPPETVRCPYPLCQSLHVLRRQVVVKPLRDPRLDQVKTHRYDCRSCGRTFRVYPRGVSHAHTSTRPRGTAVMRYLPGLSYGAPSLALGALGIPVSKTAVYDPVLSRHWART